LEALPVCRDKYAAGPRSPRPGSEIVDGQGYAVYLGAGTGIAADHRVFFSTPGPAEARDIECKPLNVRLYCDGCADALFAEGVCTNARQLRVEMPPEDANSPDPGETLAG